MAVADAVGEERASARMVTSLPGGSGAVREAVERLLDVRGFRERAVEAFLALPDGFAVGVEERGGSPA